MATMNESPDYLAPSKKGKGVRRLNKMPLVIVFVVVSLVVTGFCYAYFSRYYEQQQEAAKAKKSVNNPTVTTVARPSVRPQNQGSDYIPPAFVSDDSEQRAHSQVPVDVHQDREANEPERRSSVPSDGSWSSSQRSSGPSDVNEAQQRRARIIQQIEDNRLAKLEEALSADTVVQTNGGQTLGKTLTQQGNDSDMPVPNMMPPQNNAGHLNALPFPSDGDGNSMAAENRQDQKKAFLANTQMPEESTYLPHQRKAAIAPTQEIKAGTVIPGVLISGVNSDLPGQIIGQVREGVYDSATGMHLLIPPGARLIGTYDSSVTLGQERALVAWQRIIYPDASSISIDKMSGADQSGYSGFYDTVNNHYWRIFGNGLLLSIFSAGIQLSQPQASNGENYNNSQIVAASMGQQMGQIGMQMAQRNMNIQPTLQIRPGYEFNIMVNKDIILPTWEGHPLANGQ